MSSNKNTCIVSVDHGKLTLPLTEPFAIASGAQASAENVWVRITLANGVVGIGEAAPFTAVSGETQQSTLKAIENLKSIVLGKDVRNWMPIAHSLNEKEHDAAAARCGIEMALLDALTKHFNIPLHVFFGGSGIKLETDMTITAGGIKHAEQSAKAIFKRGISSIKIKTGGADLDYDVKRLKAIHKAVPHATLLMDGNCGYTADGAIKFVKLLEKEKIYPILFEQPLPRDDWEGMAKVSRSIAMPVCADESARDSKDILKIIKMKCANAVNIKLMKCGVEEAVRMMAIAEAAGLQLMIGGMVESILAMSFSAHLAAGRGSFTYVDLDTPLFIKKHPFTGGFKQKGAILTLDADYAGHGVELK